MGKKQDVRIATIVCEDIKGIVRKFHDESAKKSVGISEEIKTLYKNYTKEIENIIDFLKKEYEKNGVE